MSKAKINSVEYDELRNHVKSASDCLIETQEYWGDRFEDLYYAFITSGYLNDLYEDAKSNYYTLKKSCSALANVATGASLGCAIGSAIPGLGNIAGAIIGAVIGMAFGVYKFCTTDPVWITSSKEAFEQLLTDCVNGNNDCYIGLNNIGTKLNNVQISLEEIRTKINEFNYKYASLQESMDEFSLKGQMSDDGVLLSVDTEIVVGGELVSTSVSEALNAFYTYQSTVMASRIEAQLLADQYGLEIDYDALVQNANGFIVNTLDSGLYSHEFIDALLPTYTPDVAGATDLAANNLGISTSEFESALQKAAGMVGVGAGLIGAGYIGKLAMPDEEDNDPSGTPPGPSTTTPSGNENPDKDVDTDKNTSGPSIKEELTTSTGTSTPPSNDNTPTNTDPSNNNNNGGSDDPGTSDTSRGNEVQDDPGVQQEEDPGTSVIPPVTPDVEDPNKNKDIVENDVKLDDILKSELPEKVESEIVKDYDDLARREYEALGEEEINARRESIMEEIDSAYESGDFNAIKEKLRKYGYSDPEIESIIQDRDKLALAMISGDQNEYMAEKAAELAAADGVEGFESEYSESAKYSDLTDGSANSLLANMSLDEEVSDAFNELSDATLVYEEKVEETAAALEAVADAKENMVGIEEKYTEEFGTSDTTKWSEEAANEYNDAIKDYNQKVTEAEEKMELQEKAKENYDKALKEYENAKSDFEERIKNNVLNDDSGESSDRPLDDNDGSDGSDTSDGYIPDDGEGGASRGDGETNYIPFDEEFPGIALDTPSDNSLYAAENLGSDGVYTQSVEVTNDAGEIETVTESSVGADFATGNPQVSTGIDAETGGVQFGTPDDNGVASNVVSLSNDDLLAALLLEEEEAKVK